MVVEELGLLSLFRCVGRCDVPFADDCAAVLCTGSADARDVSPDSMGFLCFIGLPSLEADDILFISKNIWFAHFNTEKLKQTKECVICYQNDGIRCQPCNQTFYTCWSRAGCSNCGRFYLGRCCRNNISAHMMIFMTFQFI